MLKTKRIYSEISGNDGLRILVDRLWPRGINKDKAKLSLWLKDIAPSNELRKSFAHLPGHWADFKKRYFDELKGKEGLLNSIIEKMDNGNVTFLYGAKDMKHNNAVALREYILLRYAKMKQNMLC